MAPATATTMALAVLALSSFLLNTSAHVLPSLSSSADALPNDVLSFTLQQNRGSGTNRPAKRDLDSITSSISDHTVNYSFNLSIGTPPQPINMVLDTGSWLFWVPSVTMKPNASSGGFTSPSPFNSSASSTYKTLSKGQLSITYSDTSAAQCDAVQDTVYVGSATLTDFKFGLAYSTPNDNSGMGVLGLHPIGAANSKNGNDASHTNLIQSLKAAGAIAAAAFSVHLNTKESSSGSLTIGGVDKSLYSDPLVPLPIQSLGNDLLGVDVADIYISSTSPAKPGSLTPVINSTNLLPKGRISACLDTGSSSVYLPSDVVKALYSFVGGLTFDKTAGNPPTLPCSRADELNARNATITFSFGAGGKNAKSSLVSVPLATFIASTTEPPSFGPDDTCRFAVLEPLATGYVTLGVSFLQSALVVFDLEQSQVAVTKAVQGSSGSHVVAIDPKTGIAGLNSPVS